MSTREEDLLLLSKEPESIVQQHQQLVLRVSHTLFSAKSRSLERCHALCSKLRTMALVIQDATVAHIIEPERSSPSLTFEQARSLECLKERLDKEGVLPLAQQDNRELLRFLRARKYNVDNAYTMYTKYLKWRVDFGVDKITAEDVQSELIKNKAYLHYRDRKGRPCVLAFGAKHHPSTSDVATVVRLAVYILETALREAPDNETICVLGDYSGWSITQVDYPLIKAGIDVLQNYYPERLGAVYICNTPWYLNGVWRIVRPWLDPVTREKVKFIDNPKEILQYFEPECLPQALGGTSTFEPTGLSIGAETLSKKHPAQCFTEVVTSKSSECSGESA